MKKFTSILLVLAGFIVMLPTANATGYLSLSQTSVSVNVGSSVNITAYPSSGQIVNLTSVSNSSIAYAIVSGNQISIYGLASGYTQMTFCTYDNSCATVNVTVGSGSGNLGQISFSQNNLNLNLNQTQTISVFNNAGSSVYISSNSNPNVANAYLSGNTINITAQNQGSTTLTVCSSNSACNYLYINVNQATGQLSFSQNNVSLNINQSSSVTIYSSIYNPSFYISGNTNPNVITASISGSTLYLYAANYGSTNITVCTTGSSQCATLIANVSGSNQGNLFFTNLSLPQPRVSQYYSYQINVGGGNSPYYYNINSGFLPSGLSLTSSGLIYGTPNNTSTANFSIRANDNFGRSVISQNLTLTPTSGNIAGALIYNNGTLINDAGTIYITYKNTKSGFTSASAFTGLGYKWSNVISASTINLNYSGYNVPSNAVAHPWGTWLKSGTTIYFAHDSGLIPIPSMEIFNSNGGSLANVVDANSYDFLRPILPQMEYADWRLK